MNLKNVDGAIVTLTGYYNYGNVLQRYALQKFLSNSGYNFISYVDDFSSAAAMYKTDNIIKIKTPIRLIKRFMNYQKPYWYIPTHGDLHPEAKRMQNIIEFVNSNINIKKFSPSDEYRNYIVGSDQVWRDWWDGGESWKYYFLDFLKNDDINRISYAASFGKSDIREVFKDKDIKFVEEKLQKFKHISVREKSGANIIQNMKNVKEAKVVVDPTLLLSAESYSELINKTDEKYKKIHPIFCYILGETDEITKLIEDIQDVKKQPITKVRSHEGSEEDVLPPVEFWLKGFRDADLVITNSFHGMVFSVLNNTDFIVVGNENGGLARMLDFLDRFSIRGRYIDESKISSFDIKSLEPIDWSKVNKKLHNNRKNSAEWLLNAIENKSESRI